MCDSFGEFVREKRKARKISVRQFATQVDISFVYQSCIERGERSAPSYEILLKIADALYLDKDETSRLLDLASKTKSVPMVSYDLAEYVNSNPKVHECIRMSKNNGIPQSEWNDFLEHLKSKYK